MMMFYKGDKVICTSENMWVPVGTVGTVIENSSVPFVNWENNTTYALGDENMKKVNMDKGEKKAFKKGDRVQYTSNYGNVKKGMVGTIVSDTDTPHSICVDWEGFTEGHNAYFNDDRRSCWFVNGDDLELLGEIEVGDRVKLITDQYWNYGWKLPKGTRGTVVDILRSGRYTIRWDNWHEGHNGDIAYIKDHSCLFVEKEAVELVAKGKPEQKEEPKYNIVLFRQGNKVIAKLTEGKKVIITTEAKCSPEDTFNFFIGSQIALQRLMAEQVEDYEDIRYPVPETTGVREFLLY